MVVTVVERGEGSISYTLVTKFDATMKAGASVVFFAPPGLELISLDWFVFTDNICVTLTR